MGLLAWLQKAVRAGSQEPALSVPALGQYLAADQSPCPTAAGAAYRIEEHQLLRITERRQYNLLDGPEWLEEVLEIGQDADGLASQRWRPGFQNHRAVEVSYSVPITCKMS